ncbi:SAM hydrolase/SAM-dependent halogenase family protein [Methanooceanicella nereidis]|nr:SAM-dependent chlorinase/fluorinase [Methanocella sp. CWC-04]
MTVTTDFRDVYPAIMKGVIMNIAPGTNIIDITNTIEQGNILQGAFILKSASAYFPPGTIHLAVVDPGVGSKRRALVIKGERYTFVGPDNGLMIPAAREQGEFKVFEITDPEFYTDHVSPVFHGRDVFAPAAAFIAAGKEVPLSGEILDYIEIDPGKEKVADRSIYGKVVYVDGFGNMITNITGETMSGIYDYGDKIKINGSPSKFVKAYHEGSEETAIALIGSHGMLEIAVNLGSASKALSINAGDEISIEPIRGNTY